MITTNLRCPHCQVEQSVTIPETTCLISELCRHCGKKITLPNDSQNCCIICEYSDQRCPMSQEKK